MLQFNMFLEYYGQKTLWSRFITYNNAGFVLEGNIEMLINGQKAAFAKVIAITFRT